MLARSNFICMYVDFEMFLLNEMLVSIGSDHDNNLVTPLMEINYIKKKL